MAGVESMIARDPSQFWSYVNSLNTVSGVPSVMKLDGNEYTNPAMIAGGFVKFFGSVYKRIGNFTQSIGRAGVVGGMVLLTREEVITAIKKLPSKKTQGTDHVPCDLVREFWCEPSGPLLCIFNESIKRGVYPSMWKGARICPVFKAGDNTSISNYRPVSVLSSFSKVVEMCLFNLIMAYFKPIISLNQHGFVPSRSTSTNLLTWSQFVCEAMAGGDQVDVIHTDFSKAFHTVSIPLLIGRLGGVDRVVNYLALCQYTAFLSLEERVMCTAAIFAVKLLNGVIDCPDLPGQLEFRVPPPYSRCRDPFYVTPTERSVLFNSPMSRIQKTLNHFCELSELVDPFNGSAVTNSVLQNILVGTWPDLSLDISNL